MKTFVIIKRRKAEESEEGLEVIEFVLDGSPCETPATSCR